MSIDDILICAIVKNKKELDIYRMPLNEAARKHLSSIYDKEIERYLRMSSIEYDPIYKLDECELFKVSGYRLPDSCLESLNNTASLEKYTKKCGEICALLIT